MPTIKTGKRWNKSHNLVLEQGNIQEKDGNFIFSCEEAEKKYPGSTTEWLVTRYTWDEYIKRGIHDAISFYHGDFAIVEQH